MRWNRSLPVLLWLLSISTGPKALAFPEAIRHGYNNCISCHVSPTGGGLITEYGRALSLEVFSTWGSDKEAEFLDGLVPLPEWLNAGGDARTIQTYMNSPEVKQGRFFLMQADLEASVTVGKFTIDATGGREDYRVGNDGDKGDFISRRHYVLYNPTDAYYVRAGRFQKAFGINTPEHVTSTKRGLGWDENSETYNAEFSRLTEDTNLFVTLVGGRPDDHTVNSERGVSVSGNVFFGKSYKLGASAYQGSRTLSSSSKRVVGPWLLAGITDKLFVESEIDFVQYFSARSPSGAALGGLVTYDKEEYELIRGLNVYLVQDINKTDLHQAITDSQGYGTGLSWMPRPHLEFQAEYQKQKIPAIDKKKWLDWAYLFAHYYL